MADEIKPVAIVRKPTTGGNVGLSRQAEITAEFLLNDGEPLYDSLALEQARIAGLREAIGICNKHASRLSAGAGYAISFAVEDINRAIQEKSK